MAETEKEPKAGSWFNIYFWENGKSRRYFCVDGCGSYTFQLVKERATDHMVSCVRGHLQPVMIGYAMERRTENALF